MRSKQIKKHQITKKATRFLSKRAQEPKQEQDLSLGNAKSQNSIQVALKKFPRGWKVAKLFLGMPKSKKS